MDQKILKSSEIDKIRNATSGSRSRVRTRGGRLPPVNVKEISHVTAPKKVFTPNIPRRRVAVKTEASESCATPVVKREPKTDDNTPRGRGRGRGSKLFLQTEGAFLADGPALKIKRDPVETERFSAVRCSGRSAGPASSDTKVAPEMMSDLLSSYKENEAYSDDFGCLPPVRFPFLKENSEMKIKSEEPDVSIKAEIKEEDEDDKTELRKLVKEMEKKNSDTKDSLFMEKFSVKDENGVIILFKFPDCLPIADENVEEDKSKEIENKEEEASTPPPVMASLQSGPIGKFQILRSGRMRMLIGGKAFYLEHGDAAELNEAVFMKFHEDGGDLAVLARINQKLVLNPAVTDLLDDEQEENTRE